MTCQQNHTSTFITLLLHDFIQIFNPMQVVQPNPISEKVFEEQISLKCSPNMMKTLTWNPLAILALLKNKYPPKPQCGAGGTVRVSDTVRVQCCDTT